MIKFYVILCAMLLAAVDAQEQCGVCQKDNEVSCESENTYYLCMDNNKIGELQTCPGETICSSDARVCVPKTSATSVCNENSHSSCQFCYTTSKYACVSQTQYARCIGGEIAAVFSCKSDEICIFEAQSEFKTVCVPECAAKFISQTASCPNADYTPTTAAPPTTPSLDNKIKRCQEASSGITSTWFYAPYDQECKSYVYCQRRNLNSQDWTAIYRTCPATAPYFNEETYGCVVKRPASCIVTTTTTTTPNTSTEANPNTEENPEPTEPKPEDNEF
ncbi:uncharacterized protein LOC108600506 [Drosophila busckii]|nr:uncharacterized protein LOC108600506 [Drosophila busckii]